MTIEQKLEIELRTKIDVQMTILNGGESRVTCEDWEDLQKNNFVIKAALAAMANAYIMGNHDTVLI